MAKFFNSKSDLAFWLIAIGLFIFMVIYGVYSASFFLESINGAFNSNLIKKGEIVNFNLNKVRQLER